MFIYSYSTTRFFDMLDPTFAHMISLGQTNTIISCPGLTTHSELLFENQKDVEIYPHTIRVAMGIESRKDFIEHFIAAA